MSDHSHQPATERQHLLRYAAEFDRQRDHLTTERGQDSLPALATATRQLEHLTACLQNLSAEILQRDTDGAYDPRLSSSLRAYAEAVEQVGRAVGHYSVRVGEIGFLRDVAAQQETHVLREARNTALTVARDRIGRSADSMDAASARLHNEAARLQEADAQSVSRAARTHSTHPKHVRSPSPAELEAPTDAHIQQPSHAPGAVRGR